MKGSICYVFSLLVLICMAVSTGCGGGASGGNGNFGSGGGKVGLPHFQVSAVPNATVGTPFRVTVTCLDSPGSVSPVCDPIVHFTSTDKKAILPPDSMLNRGLGGGSVTLESVGTWTVTVTSVDEPSVTGTSNAITVSPTPSKIQHVVVIFQENRTPDNLFHDPVLMANGADIASSGLKSSGATVPITPTPFGVDYDLGHSHSAFVAMYDGGKMDGADKIGVVCPQGTTNCPPPNPQYKYVQASDVAPYFQMAEQYTFGDRMFQTNQGPSFPAHQFILSGTSAPTATSSQFASENPNGGAGCAAAPGSLVALIDPDGIESSSIYPCFEHPALTDELDAKGLSWRYYTPSAGSIWTAPNAIQHLCGPNVNPPNATACVGSNWVSNVVLYTAQNPAPILTDILNNRLPAVSWVIPTFQNSDHPGAYYATSSTGGPSWVASIVNAVGTSSYWSNTAIIITWDDWGGWYDHVPPPQVSINNTTWGSGYVYGFRVPLIVVSPYAKAGYISHVTHDFGSILNFIEHVFNLSSLGYADAHADDLSDCFNSNQTPLQFQMITAPLNADHFLNDRTPPADPDDE